MATIEKTIDVEVPVSVAYDQWTQFETFPQFMSGIVAVDQVDDSHVHWVAEVGGERRSWDVEITEQVPDRVIAWRSLAGVENHGRVQFEPTDRGTRLTVKMEYDPEGMKESVGAMFGADDRQVEEDLERFRDLIESSGAPTGAWRGEIMSGQVVGDDRV